MTETGYQLAKDYEKGNLIGWGEMLQPGIAKEQFNLLRGSFKPLNILGQTRATEGRKMFLWQVVREVLGRDTENYRQEIGDCVSFGAKNATEYVTCCQIFGLAAREAKGDQGQFKELLSQGRIKFKPVFPPWYYGTGRVYVGGGRLGNSDGSLGSWMADAVMKYGTLFSDHEGVPRYAGQIAKAWGDPNPSNDLDNWKDIAKDFLVRSAAPIRSWDELVAAIVNGYPCTVASNIGYSMTAGQNGFHAQTANWAHQMCIVGIDDEYSQPYAAILNSWGDVHGRLKDFHDGHDWPIGIIRARRQDIEKMIRAQEVFAWSQFDGFPEQLLDKALFKLI